MSQLIKPKPYISLDLETTGLDWDKHQVLEIGAVIDDWETPVEALPTFQILVQHDIVIGDYFALNMNAELLLQIHQEQGTDPYYAWEELADFVRWHLGEGRHVFGGAACASFDLNWMPKHLRADIAYHHTIEIGSLFFDPLTGKPGNTTKVQEIIGIKPEKSHRALEDAIWNVHAIRFAREKKLRELSQ